MNSTYVRAHRPSFSLSLYRVSALHPLNTKVLSYSNRPPRVANVAHIQVAEGDVDWSGMFSCDWDELLSFELACFGSDREGFAEADCGVEWWQNKAEEDPETGKTASGLGACFLTLIFPYSNIHRSTCDGLGKYGRRERFQEMVHLL